MNCQFRILKISNFNGNIAWHLIFANITVHILHYFPQGFSQRIFFPVVQWIYFNKARYHMIFSLNTILKLLEVVIFLLSIFFFFSSSNSPKLLLTSPKSTYKVSGTFLTLIVFYIKSSRWSLVGKNFWI